MHIGYRVNLYVEADVIRMATCPITYLINLSLCSLIRFKPAESQRVITVHFEW